MRQQCLQVYAAIPHQFPYTDAFSPSHPDKVWLTILWSPIAARKGCSGIESLREYTPKLGNAVPVMCQCRSAASRPDSSLFHILILEQAKAEYAKLR